MEIRTGRCLLRKFLERDKEKFADLTIDKKKVSRGEKLLFVKDPDRTIR